MSYGQVVQLLRQTYSIAENFNSWDITTTICTTRYVSRIVHSLKQPIWRLGSIPVGGGGDSSFLLKQRGTSRNYKRTYFLIKHMKYIYLRLVCHKKRFVVAVTRPMSSDPGGSEPPKTPPLGTPL